MSTRAHAIESESPRRVAWLEVAVLLTCVLARARGFAEHVDLHMEDELVTYLAQGRALAREGGWPHLSYSPISVLVYALLDRLPLAGLLPVDAMYWLCVVAVPLAAWWALRGMVPKALALVAAGWVGSSVRLLQADCIGGMAMPHVYACNLALVFVALGAAARARAGLALSALAVAAINRSELLPWLAAFGVALACRAPIGWSRRWRFLGATTLVAGSLALLLSAGHQERSWIAFQQHYLATQPGTTDSVRQVAADFPTAQSVLGAIREQPARFARHFGGNLAAVPGRFLPANMTTLLPTGWGAPIWGLLLAAALGGWVARWRRVAGQPWPWPLSAMVVTGPCAVVLPLLVSARAELLWPLLPPMVAVVVAGLAGWGAGRSRAIHSVVAGAGMLALMILVPGPFRGDPLELQHRRVLALLHQQPPTTGALVAAAWPSYAELLDRRDLVLFSPGRFDPVRYQRFLDGRAGDVIVLTPDLVQQLPSWSEFQQLVERPPWRATASRGAVTVYTRERDGR